MCGKNGNNKFVAVSLQVTNFCPSNKINLSQSLVEADVTYLRLLDTNYTP